MGDDPRDGRLARSMAGAFYIGCAGWALPKPSKPGFPSDGTHLERYAARLPAVEINSSFYRPHQPKTYARWGACVPPEFRFSVKVPKAITHELRLAACEPLLDAFLGEATALGPRLGCLLVQLPPSFAFDAGIAGSFLDMLRARHAGPVALEPRHATWFGEEATRLVTAHRIARVAADPARVPAAGEPACWREIVYYRLHGSPRIYYSTYSGEYLDALADRLRAAAAEADAVWCIFDNTALDAAMPNALGVLERLGGWP